MLVSNVSGSEVQDGRMNKPFISGQKEGHKSFECPEGGQGGGNKSGSLFLTFSFAGIAMLRLAGGCFNCGKDGHKSFECSEPKKAGGRGGAGGERSSTSIQRR